MKRLLVTFAGGVTIDVSVDIRGAGAGATAAFAVSGGASWVEAFHF